MRVILFWIAAVFAFCPAVASRASDSGALAARPLDARLLETRLKALLPVRIEDIDLGYTAVLTGNRKATVETSSAKSVSGAKPGTWEIREGYLVLRRSFDGKHVDESKYPLAISGGKLAIDGDAGTVDPKSGRIYTVNTPD